LFRGKKQDKAVLTHMEKNQNNETYFQLDDFSLRICKDMGKIQ